MNLPLPLPFWCPLFLLCVREHRALWLRPSMVLHGHVDGGGRGEEAVKNQISFCIESSYG